MCGNEQNYQSRKINGVGNSKPKFGFITPQKEKPLDQRCKECDGSEEELKNCEIYPNYCHYVMMQL